jgi:hypothetical protein
MEVSTSVNSSETNSLEQQNIARTVSTEGKKKQREKHRWDWAREHGPAHFISDPVAQQLDSFVF